MNISEKLLKIALEIMVAVTSSTKNLLKGDSTKSTTSVNFGFLALNLLVFGLLPQNFNIIEEKYVLKDSYTFCTIYFVKSSFISNNDDFHEKSDKFVEDF